MPPPDSPPLTPEDRRVIRVAHLLDGRHFGGAEQMVRRLIEAAPREAIEAWAYCLREGRLAEFLRAEGLRVRVLGAAGKYDWRVVGRVARAAREDRIDILQAHTSRTHLLARLASARLGIPNVTTIHSPIARDENRSTAAHPLRAWVERLGRPWTQHIVSVGREEAERLSREERVSAAKLSWIPNGVDPPPPEAREDARAALSKYLAGTAQPLEEKIQPLQGAGYFSHGRQPVDQASIWGRAPAGGGIQGAPDTAPPFVIAMIAQMRPRKGPEVLLRAFARWRAAGGGAGGRGVLLMIGDDEFTQGAGYLESLKTLARDLGISDSVRFTGFMAEPWALAGGADLIALPSLFGEGLPLVLLEAMSRVLPLAVSDSAGNRELARDAACGWIHPPGDAAALARDLTEAAAHPDSTRAKGEAGRRYFEDHFTLDRVIGRYRELYDKMITA